MVAVGINNELYVLFIVFTRGPPTTHHPPCSLVGGGGWSEHSHGLLPCYNNRIPPPSSQLAFLPLYSAPHTVQCPHLVFK